MKPEELKKELDEGLKGLKDQVTKAAEGNQEAVKSAKDAVADLEQKMEKAISEGVEEGVKEFKDELETLKKHAAKLDAKLNEVKTPGSEVKPTYGEMMAKMLKENIERIGNVGHKSSKEAIELKAVGDMTLGANLTGDQPRDYSMQVAMKPGQLLNFSDLVATVAISGGTYTYPRETTSEGSISTQADENTDKSQIDYDLEMIDVSTDFLAGFARYSKKMRNNLPFLESFIPAALRRDYFIAENTQFSAELATLATASTVTEGNNIERLISEIAALEGINYAVSGIVLNPAQYWEIMVTEKSAGAGYGLPGIVTVVNGNLFINGIPILKANWVAANKYFVGDWSFIQKVVTEGLNLEFSTEDKDNFTKNKITARIEAQIALAVMRPDAIIYGDFTTTV